VCINKASIDKLYEVVYPFIKCEGLTYDEMELKAKNIMGG
jgi:hypothetical protein